MTPQTEEEVPVETLWLNLIWTVACTKAETIEEACKQANEYKHPGTTNGWVVPNADAWETFVEANPKVFGPTTPVNKVACQEKEGFYHYVLHC
jgi:hypothetical protein